MLGALWPSPQLALGNARYTASCSDVACMERRWNRLLVLGCQLLWEGNSSQRWGYCLCIITPIWLSILSFHISDAINSFLQIRFRRGLPPGDGVLFYPGQVFSNSQQPVASLRLERLLSGLQVRSSFSAIIFVSLNIFNWHNFN